MTSKTYVILSILVLAATMASPSTTSGRRQQQRAPTNSPEETADTEANRTSAESSTKKLPFDPHDLSGVWWVHQRTNFTLSTDPPPMTTWAIERYNAAKPGLSRRGQPLGNDPILMCDPMGYPRILFWNNYPDEILQTPNRIVMFFDWFYLSHHLDRRTKIGEEPRTPLVWQFCGPLGRRYIGRRIKWF